jgi:hypothetical protein
MTTVYCTAPGEFINWRTLPDGHWVGVRLPDGRHVVTDGREPVAAAMRKVNAAIAGGKPPDPAWFAGITAWLDSLPVTREERTSA